MPIYMKIEGVSGEVTEDGHKDWIEVNSFQFGVGRGISTPVGATTNRECSTPSISEVTVSKQTDKSSIDLLGLSLSDRAGKKVEFDFVTTGAAGHDIYLHYEFDNTLISGYSMSSGGDRPSESLSLNFTKFTEKFTPAAVENKAAAPITKGFDLSTSKMI